LCVQAGSGRLHGISSSRAEVATQYF
jgi:hypothetical protein